MTDVGQALVVGERGQRHAGDPTGLAWSPGKDRDMAPECRETHQEYLQQRLSGQRSDLAEAYEALQVLARDGMGLVNDYNNLTPPFVLGEQGTVECLCQLCRVSDDRIEAKFPADHV